MGKYRTGFLFSIVDVKSFVHGEKNVHIERRALDGKIYRHDNSPHKRWESVATFPKHFHDGSEMNVSESHPTPPAQQGTYLKARERAVKELPSVHVANGLT